MRKEPMSMLGKSPSVESPDSGRRSFFVKLGAGVSGAVASMAGIARAGTRDEDELSLRVAALEAERSLRELHESFRQAMDRRRYEVAVELFADDAQVVFNGGVFDNGCGGVRRLFLERFRSGKTGGRMEPAPGFEVDADQRQDRVDVASDLLSASAVFPYSIQVGREIQTESSVASMARLQGGGVQTWWEGGEYRVTYRRDARHESWRIGRLEYHTASRADYRPGRSYANAIAVPPMSRLYPDDPQGPDALI